MIHWKTATYSCPAHTELKKDVPGRCPICGMKLVQGNGAGPFQLGQSELKKKFLTALVLAIPIVFLHIFSSEISSVLSLKTLGILEMIVSTVVIWWIGSFVMKRGLNSFLTFRMNVMTLAATGVLIAYLYSVIKLLMTIFNYGIFESGSLNALFFEPSTLIMILILGGLYIEGVARKKVLEDVQSLKELIPCTAHLVLEKGEERKVAIDDIKKGDVVRVKPNEKIPADGTVLEGQSWVQEIRITGEYLPIYKRIKDSVFQGSLNGNNSLLISVDRVEEDTLLAKTIQLVAASTTAKTPLQEKMGRIMAIFVLIVLFITLAVFLLSLHFDASYFIAFCRAVSVLLVASPASLAFSVPLPETVGVIVGVSHGVLVQQREALERMDRVNTLVIDKSGALTEGRPLLTKIFAQFPFSENEVLRWGASVESASPHPLGQSYVMGAKLKQLPLMKASNFQTLEGKGVVAKVDGSRVAVGNARLLEELGIESTELAPEAEKVQKEGLTVSYIAVEDKAVGFLGVVDPLRYTAERALEQLKKKGIKIVLATGDSKEVAVSIGKRLAFDEIASELLISDKLALIKRLQSEGREVAMAGDGDNDAAAMSQADVGIALGLDFKFRGGQTSVTLMKPDLKGIVRLRDLSKKTIRTAKENIGFALGYNILSIPLASGLLYPLTPIEISPFISCVLMTLSTLVVVGNSLRLRKLVLNKD